MKHTLPALLAIAAIGTFTSCSKDDPAEVDLGHDYFPQNIGHWIEYQVDSMRVQLVSGNVLDTALYSYPLREVLVENITDAEGRPAQRVVRYLRDANNTWLPKDVWWQTRDNVRAERSEENLRRIKLVFPPREGTEWRPSTDHADCNARAPRSWSVKRASMPSARISVSPTDRARTRFVAGVAK